LKRRFEHKLSKKSVQCPLCGLDDGYCLCDVDIHLESQIEIWLLTHHNEFARTSNTGRLIEYAMDKTRVFDWQRTEAPQELIKLLEDPLFDVYLVFSDDRPSEKMRSVSYQASNKQVAFIILDGTWKEVRKIIRKSPYLDKVKILPLHPESTTAYKLRRNKDDHHLCTVEVGIELLELVGEKENASRLNAYFQEFMKRYHAGAHDHIEVKNDN